MTIFAILIFAILLVVPFWFLLPRAGIPQTVAFVAVIPLGAVILLWILAFKEWPGDDAKEG